MGVRFYADFVGGVWFEFADGTRTFSSLLPIMLLNDGFDVWIGHSRTTYWRNEHVHLTPTDREYWNWTWDQHVEFDLPAQLLFISTETNQPVHFIGASQAAAVGAAAATFLETAQMIRSLILIGPTAYRGYTNSLLLEAWACYFGLTLDSEYYISGYQAGAFNYSREFPQSGPFSAQGLTNTSINLISGPNCCLSNSAPSNSPMAGMEQPHSKTFFIGSKVSSGMEQPHSKTFFIGSKVSSGMEQPHSKTFFIGSKVSSPQITLYCTTCKYDPDFGHDT